MNFEQAISILTQVTSQINANRDTHAQIVAALECLKKLAFPDPSIPPLPKPPRDR